MKNEEKGVAITPKKEIAEFQRQSASVESMIMSAIKEKVPAETMERFLAMRKELKAEFAKEQFDIAMAKFQGECPVIAKEKPGNNYKYAPLDAIISQVRGLLKECGFSYRIETKMEGDNVTATCIAIHKDGHSEKSSFTAKVEKVVSRSGSTVRTAMQDSAASLTFAKRYAFCNAFGIMTGDEDNEKALSQEQVSVPQNQVEEAIAKLDHCMTLPKLKEVWSTLSKEQKANKDIIRHANEIKSNIENEQNS